MNKEKINSLQEVLEAKGFVGIVFLSTFEIEGVQDGQSTYFLVVHERYTDLFEILCRNYKIPYGPIRSPFGEATIRHYLDVPKGRFIALYGNGDFDQLSDVK
jgi:hypothetical protein